MSGFISEVRDFARRNGLNEKDVAEYAVERAAIREFDGNMSRDEAEKAALIETFEKFRR